LTVSAILTVVNAQNTTNCDADGLSVEDRVLDALRKSGYTLELRVAAKLRKTDAVYVAHTRQYVDRVTGKVRESDVVACWRANRGNDSVFVYLVIECKNKPSPWVVFEPDEDVVDVGELFDSLYHWEYNRANSWAAVSDAGFPVEGTLLAPARIGRSVVEPIKKKGDAPDGAFMAVQAAVSAVEGFQGDIDLSHLPSRRVTVVIIPVVVTSGLLFRGGLGEGEDIGIERTEFAQVGTRTGPNTLAKRCLITTEAGLLDVVAAVEATASALLPGS
jgi:hypothetical protein